MKTDLAPSLAELDLLQNVVREHGLEAGLEALCLGLSNLFRCQVRIAALDPDGQFETPAPGSQTEWLEVQGHSYGLFIIRSEPYQRMSVSMPAFSSAYPSGGLMPSPRLSV